MFLLDRLSDSPPARAHTATLILILLILALAVLTPPATADTLLVANKSDATLSFIDLESGEEVATVATGEGPHEVAVSPDGNTAVVTNYGRGAAGNTLTVVDVPRAEVKKTIDLGEYRRPHGIEFVDSRHVAVTAEGARALVVVDLESGEVEKAVETGQETSHMVSLAGNRAYVANIGSGSVTAIDLARGENLGSVETGAGAEGIVVSSDGSAVWVSNRGADTITLVDADSLEVVKTLESNGFPIRAELTPDGERLLVTNARASTLTVVATGKRAVAETVPIKVEAADPEDRLFGDRFGDSSVPIGIEISPAGDRAFIAHANADAIQVLDLETWETIGTLRAGREPDGMAYSEVDVRPVSVPEQETGAEKSRSDAGIEFLSEVSYLVDIGIKKGFGPNTVLFVVASENLVNFRNSADFGVHAGLTWTFD